MPIYWQDRDVRFDISLKDLEMAHGEVTINRIEPVEDTKGGNSGILIFTNLRVLWFSSKTAKLNITIGYNTITIISKQTIQSKMYGQMDALYLLTKTSSSKFEFLFTQLNHHEHICVDLVALVTAIQRSYVLSKPFREIRLRHHIIQSNKLKLLPGEQEVNRVEGVWNLAANQGNLGCFIITNTRLVWFASTNHFFNFSLPYLQVSKVCIRNSLKFGQVFVVESIGGYVLGFRIEPLTRLQEVQKEIDSLFVTQTRFPCLGVQVNAEDLSDSSTLNSTSRPVEQDTKEDGSTQCFCTNYWVENSNSTSNAPNFSAELGLAFEPLPDGLDRNSLWKIII